MDKYNTFHTRTTYALVRLDWAVLMFLAIALLFIHRGEVNWGRFTIAFLLPDLIGTLPGLYYYYARRSGPHRSIPPVIHKLYNFGHCFAVVALFCGVWWLMTGSFEWAMLAFPIHLTGDRSIFGNIYKPLGTAFEPVKHEAFKRFEKDYLAAGNW
jgi:hypothetical protein